MTNIRVHFGRRYATATGNNKAAVVVHVWPAKKGFIKIKINTQYTNGEKWQEQKGTREENNVYCVGGGG